MESSWGDRTSPGILARLTGPGGRGRLRSRRGRFARVPEEAHGRRRGDLLHGLLDGPGRARPGAGGARVRARSGRRSTRTSRCHARPPFPQGGDLPKKYYDVMDPFVTLAAAAGGHHHGCRSAPACAWSSSAIDPHRQGGLHPRPALRRRPHHLRHQGRGYGSPPRRWPTRHRLREPLQADARARAQAMKKEIWTKPKPKFLRASSSRSRRDHAVAEARRCRSRTRRDRGRHRARMRRGAPWRRLRRHLTMPNDRRARPRSR